MKVWCVGNADLLDKYADTNITADYTHFEKPYKGIMNYKSMLKMTYEYFPDMKIRVQKFHN
jgi:hypothetical protein